MDQNKVKGKKKWIAAAAVGIVVLIGAATCESGDETTGSAAPRPQSEVTLMEGQAGEGPTLPSLLPPTESNVPREHEQALKSAESYLRHSHFSYQGLYQQLTSEYGEGFPPDAAQYAMDNVDVDWNAEAVEAAESYLKYQTFSRQGLIDQLSSEYGSGFTQEQAQQAVDAVY